MDSGIALTLNNETSRPIVVWIEPLGEDYTMLPKDKIDIVPSAEELSSLEYGRPTIFFQDDKIIVYTFLNYEVYFNDIRVECGHQRMGSD